MRTLARRTLATGATALVLMAASARPVHAQQSQAALAAEALFDEAQKLVEQGKLKEACEKFAASQKLDPATGTLLNLAACHEKEGKTATAWLEYKDAEAQSARAGDKQRVDYARKRIAELEKKLTRTAINVQAPLDGMVVKIDGVELAREVWGTKIPMDPIEHKLEVTAPGMMTFKDVFTPTDGGTVEVPPLAPEKPAVKDEEPPPPPPKEPEPPPSAFNMPLLIGGISAATVGVAGIVTAVVFGVTASSQAAERDKYCKPVGSDPQPCRDQRAFDADAAARNAQTGMIVTGIIGLVGIAAGATMIALSPQKQNPASAGLVIRPEAAPGYAGLSFGGTFR
jgi:hypothetical protein